MGRFLKKYLIGIIVLFFIVLFPSDSCAEESIFNVTVPMNLPITMDSMGKVCTATDRKITNNSVVAVKVSNVKVKLNEIEGWIVNPDLDRSTAKVDGKEIAMTINNHTVLDSGDLDGFTEWLIEKNSNLPLNYNASLPSQSDNRNELIGYVVFTIDWAYDFYKVEFLDANIGGTIDGTGPHIQYINKKETIRDFPTVTPSQGYSFRGWIDAYEELVDETTPITSHMVLQPKFEISQAEQTTDDGNYIFNIETRTIVEYIGANKENLTVPSSLLVNGEIYQVKTIGENAFQHKQLSGELRISQGIEEIKANAFWENSLQSVHIPNSISTIGNSAFRYNNIGGAFGARGKVYIDNYEGGIRNLASNAFNNNLSLQIFPAPVEYLRKAPSKSSIDSSSTQPYYEKELYFITFDRNGQPVFDDEGFLVCDVDEIERLGYLDEFVEAGFIPSPEEIEMEESIEETEIDHTIPSELPDDTISESTPDFEDISDIEKDDNSNGSDNSTDEGPETDDSHDLEEDDENERSIPTDDEFKKEHQLQLE